MNILSALRSQSSSADKGKAKAASQPGPKPSKGIEIKSRREVELMRESALIVATVLKEISQIIAPGMTTRDLDAHAEKRIREMGAVPSFKGYHGFPASICAMIKAGDIVKVDTGAYKNGFHGDSCITLAVPPVSDRAAKLVRVAEEALFKGIERVKAGSYLLDIAGAIQDHVVANGFSVVEDFTGHGVGRNLHEEPSVFNFRTHQLPNVKLRAGMTLAIEPIVNAGSKTVRILSDKWTAVTVDNQLSAQFEHTVLVTEDGYEILTDRSKV
jgi:methionyl aminopeptidase